MANYFKLTPRESSSKRKYWVALIASLASLAFITLLPSSEDAQKIFDEDAGSATMQNFLSFINIHGRQYDTKEIMSQRYMLFKKRSSFVAQHNADTEAPFELEVNSFSDYSEEELNSLLKGLKLPDKKEFLKERSKSLQASNNLPEYKNWFEEGYVSVPGHQGMCGSCWAFSSAAMLETLSVLKGQYTELPRFSV